VTRLSDRLPSGCSPRFTGPRPLAPDNQQASPPSHIHTQVHVVAHMHAQDLIKLTESRVNRSAVTPLTPLTPPPPTHTIPHTTTCKVAKWNKRNSFSNYFPPVHNKQNNTSLPFPLVSRASSSHKRPQLALHISR